MKLVVGLTFLFATISASSQEVKTTHSKGKISKVSIGVNFSPGVAFRTYTLTSQDPQLAYVHHFYDSIEKPKFGFTTGLNVLVEFTKHIGLQTGVQYANQGYDTRWIGAGSFKSHNSYSFHMLNIPVKVNFKWGNGKVYFVGSAGLNLDIYMAYTNSFTIQDSLGNQNTHKHTYTSTFDQIHRFNLSAIASAGIGYDFNKQHSLRFEPTFQHQLLSQYNGDNTKTYLWSAGLNVAYYFAVR